MSLKNALLSCLVLLFIFSLNSCSSNSKTVEETNNNLENLAKERLVDNYNFYYTRDSSFVLAKKLTKRDLNDPFTSIRFFIYDLHNNDIIHEEVIPRGDAKWISNHQVEISNIPGILKGDETMGDYVFIYDVNTKKKHKKSLKKKKKF